MSKLTLNKTEDIEIFLDPFRSKIMRVMKDEHKPMTVKEIADYMGEVPAKVHYHVKKLEAIGVLFIKNTKVVNGIVAKYYDFTTDSISLSVPNSDQKADILRSRVMKEYGRYFDEVKQKFFDLVSIPDDDKLSENNVYISIKDSYLIEPDNLDKLSDDIKELLEKYKSDSKDAVDYNFFCSFMRNCKKS